MQFTTNEELQDFAQSIAQEIQGAVLDWDNSRARSQQSEARVLGMSDLGGCLEFIRATIAGDKKAPATRLKLAAVVGTALGDLVESAATKFLEGTVTQGRVTVTLPISGIKVSGSTDMRRSRKILVDLKTKDGTDTVRHEGPSLENIVQISGYLVGGNQQGDLDDDAVAVLVYIDRSGRDPQFYGYAITMDQAIGYLEMADARLEDVAKALQTGEVAGYLRDKPESWCYHVECPFYNQCWEGYEPTEELHPDEEEQVRLYDKGRAMAKAGANMQREAKTALYTDPDHNVQGTGRNFQIKWVPTASSSGTIYDKIDVRALRKPAPDSEGEPY
jgi:hypothetical protein